MINRKILASLVVIGVVGAVAGSGTLAYFSDTETSEDNTFTAGSINAYFASVDAPKDTGVDLEDYFTDDGESTAFIVEGDVKPGDVYERTMALAVTDNPSHVCLAVTNVEDNENDLIEPEEQAGDTSEDEGELGDNLEMRAWVDDGNNQYDSDSDTDRYIVGGQESWVSVPQGDTVYDLVDNGYNAFETGDGPLTPGIPRYLAAEVRLPTDTGNEAQTDSYVMDLVLYAVQERNNEDFDCQEDVDASDLVAPTTTGE